VGDVLVFDGVNLRHGNVPNETGLTRVSFDFHVIPVVKFVARPQASSINTRLPFTIGQDSYFDTLAAPEAH
jgi:ectoine hydroxylase-related dioxygenase (phytanoyl-CoA dioxygenase family)